MNTKIFVMIIITVALGAVGLPGPACSGETRVYDRDGHLKYRVDESGRIYDKDWNRQGQVQDGKVYDRDWNLKYRIEDNRIYDRDWKRRGQRDGSRLYDRDGKLEYRIEERQ